VDDILIDKDDSFCEIKRWGKHSFIFFSGWVCALAKKMKVCFVRWHRNSNYFFVRWRFFNYLFFVRLPVRSKRCQVVRFVLKCPFKVRPFDVCTVAIRVTDNGWQPCDVLV